MSHGGTFYVHVWRNTSLDLKEWKSYDELADILEEKGIVISDRAATLSFLNIVNYYRFSGYFLPFNLKRANTNTVPFETVQKIYEFDGKIRNLITSVLDIVENYLKDQIGHYHGGKYGAEGYMDPKNFNFRHNDIQFKKHISTCITENRRTFVVKHHTSVYGGHFPIWVIIEYFSMGMLSYFYSDLPNKDKKALAMSMYSINYQIFESWTRCITDLRNKCAHFTRLYYWTFTAIPKMPAEVKYIPNRRLFAQLMMLKLMYPDHERWNRDFVRPLIKLVKDFKPYISYSHIGFPYQWKSMLKY